MGSLGAAGLSFTVSVDSISANIDYIFTPGLRNLHVNVFLLL